MACEHCESMASILHVAINNNNIVANNIGDRENRGDRRLASAADIAYGEKPVKWRACRKKPKGALGRRRNKNGIEASIKGTGAQMGT